jgi:hypothetical protein
LPKITTCKDGSHPLFHFMIDVVEEHQGSEQVSRRRIHRGAPIDDAEPYAYAVGASLEILMRLTRLNAERRRFQTFLRFQSLESYFALNLRKTVGPDGTTGASETIGTLAAMDSWNDWNLQSVLNVFNPLMLHQATKEFQTRLLISEAVRRNLEA